jgi:hypothetical protein
LPSPNPETPFETKPVADMPSPSSEPKTEQNPMTDWETPENKTPMGNVFGTPDAVDPLGVPDSKVRSTEEVTEQVVPFLKFQTGPGRESEMHMYADLTIAQAKDKAELAGKYNLIAQDSFNFGLPGRGKVNLSSKNQRSAKQGNAGNPGTNSGNELPSTENRAALKQEEGGRNQGGKKQTTSYNDLVRLSPMPMTSGKSETQDTGPRLGAKQQPGQDELAQNRLEQVKGHGPFAPIQETDNPAKDLVFTENEEFKDLADYLKARGGKEWSENSIVMLLDKLQVNSENEELRADRADVDPDKSFGSVTPLPVARENHLHGLLDENKETQPERNNRIEKENEKTLRDEQIKKGEGSTQNKIAGEAVEKLVSYADPMEWSIPTRILKKIFLYFQKHRDKGNISPKDVANDVFDISGSISKSEKN